MNEASSKIHPLLIRPLDANHMFSLLPTQSKWILLDNSLRAIMLLLLPGLWAAAENDCEHLHSCSGTLRTLSRYQPDGTDYVQFVWDSFSVPAGRAGTETRWPGGYGPQMAYLGGDIVNFRVSICKTMPDALGLHGLNRPPTEISRRAASQFR